MESAQDNDTREVLACEESFFNALLAADHDSLGIILTDDFLIVDVMSGQVARPGRTTRHHQLREAAVR